MLGDEDGMAAEGRLLSVIRRKRRRETFRDDLPRVRDDLFHSFLADIGHVRFGEGELPPERGASQSLEKILVFCGHEGFRPRILQRRFPLRPRGD